MTSPARNIRPPPPLVLAYARAVCVARSWHLALMRDQLRVARAWFASMPVSS